MWPEVNLVKQENKRELNLNNDQLTKLLKDSNDELDKEIFEQIQLNYLQLSNSGERLREISEELGKLVNLQTLLLFGNKLTKVPSSIETLTKLKIIDLSSNQIVEFHFDLTKLDHLTSLNLSCNQITTFDVKSNSLHVLDLSGNRIAQFPVIPPCVMDVKMSKNEIVEIPHDLNFPHLKNLDLSDNKVVEISKEFGGLKLKVLNMKNNPLKDKKLHKFIQQNQALKAIMDHIIKFGVSCPVDKVSEKVSKIDMNEVKTITSQMTINKFDESFKVIYDQSVKSERRFILCCIISNIGLTPASFKEFISFQTKLHDGLCDQRRLATIATHDFDLLPSKTTIRYVSKKKEEVLVQPLGRHKAILVEEYLKSLKSEAEALRKEKKRSVYSGIYKYLNHFPTIFEQQEFAILQSENGVTLSFPPLTNSEITKMSLNTKKMLIEVTSGTSAKDCDLVMTALIRKALELSFCSHGDAIKKLEIEQVRILNCGGDVKTIYPSKIDLKALEEDSIEIIRN